MIQATSRPTTRCFAVWLAFYGVLVCVQSPGDEPAPAADQRMNWGQAAYDRGAFDEALVQWRSAADLYLRQSNSAGQMRALINLSATYQALGQHRLAFRTLEVATHLAENSPDQSFLPAVNSASGVVCGCLNQFKRAEQTLRDALAMAGAQGDGRTCALIWNNLGNLLAGQNKSDEALQAFAESVKLAQSTTNRLLIAKASANAAAVAARVARSAEADTFNRAALENLTAQRFTHDVAMLYLRCGQTDWQQRQLSRAEQSCRRALAIAEKLGDKRALTYALGYLGRFHETKGEIAPALEYTRRAIFVAQEIQLMDALYRWEWQLGRLHRARGDRDAAIAAYHHAIETLQPIRGDLRLSYNQTGATFREVVGPLYFELAGLVFEKADATQGGLPLQNILREACDSVEQLRSLELEDYLQDECLNLLRAKAARVENVGRDTAVIYIIPLATRTELVIGIGSELKRVTIPVGTAELTKEVRAFRSHLEKRTTDEYLAEARQLYQWLIAPIRPLLDTDGIQTLVFLPDGALRTVSMAALYDGEKFLIERYAVAVSPGLTLFAPQPIHWTQVQALKAGLTEAVSDRAPLPYVAAELELVQKLFGGPKLLDGEFVWPILKKEFAESQYQLVHLATHGQFERDASASYLLIHDGKLSLDQLEELIRPSQFHGRPVELLTLSACETAAGDDRAALGLAGVAIKAGARSALATSWFVHDESTALLMGEFYSQLKSGSGVTKARALQLAQLKMLSDPRFDHPFYWAAYLIIGNWL